jgi:hypothetical protein
MHTEQVSTSLNLTLILKLKHYFGLHLLREFLKVNRGAIQIVSGDGYFGQFGDDAPSFQNLRNPIAGTLVNIRVVFDNHLYQLKGEDL